MGMSLGKVSVPPWQHAIYQDPKVKGYLLVYGLDFGKTGHVGLYADEKSMLAAHAALVLRDCQSNAPRDNAPPDRTGPGWKIGR